MKLLRIVGTADGRHVVGGVFRFFETHGLPLDILVEALWRRKLVIDWLDFWDSARAAGVKPSRLVAMIEAAVADSISAQRAEGVIRRLRLLRPEAQ